jgi:hypothetical protein
MFIGEAILFLILVTLFRGMISHTICMHSFSLNLFVHDQSRVLCRSLYLLYFYIPENSYHFIIKMDGPGKSRHYDLFLSSSKATCNTYNLEKDQQDQHHTVMGKNSAKVGQYFCRLLSSKDFRIFSVIGN